MSESRVSGVQRFVQTGWTKQIACEGGRVTVFAEYYNRDLTYDYVNECNTGRFPVGDNDYYNEYNPATGALYWCNGYNGSVVMCEYASQTGFTIASAVIPYGETSHYTSTEPNVMGNKGQNLAVWITNVKYKVAQISPTQWNWVTTTGSTYAYCNWHIGENRARLHNDAVNCPYEWRQGLSGATLYTYNWTK